MDSIWFFKHCPRCGNYLKKLDPQEAGMCCCGWQEYTVGFYCEYRRRFCSDEENSSVASEKIYSAAVR